MYIEPYTYGHVFLASALHDEVPLVMTHRDELCRLMMAKVTTNMKGKTWAGTASLMMPLMTVCVKGQRLVAGISIHSAVQAAIAAQSGAAGFKPRSDINLDNDVDSGDIAKIGGPRGLTSWFIGSKLDTLIGIEDFFVISLAPGDGILIPPNYLIADIDIEDSEILQFMAISKSTHTVVQRDAMSAARPFPTCFETVQPKSTKNRPPCFVIRFHCPNATLAVQEAGR